MSFTLAHDAACTDSVRKSMWENMRDDHQPLPATPAELTDDKAAWGHPVGELIQSWLGDGSATCTCAPPDPRIMVARAYVQSRFYPPLPTAYGDLAVEAIDALAEDNDAFIVLPADIDPKPRSARVDENEEEGDRWLVPAWDLLRILRIDAFNGLEDWFDQLIPTDDTDEE